MSARQPLRCPMCGKILFEGFWVATALSVTIHCRCKRVVEIREDYTTRIIQEMQPVAHSIKQEKFPT